MLRESKLKTFFWYSSVGLLVTIAVAVSLFRIYFSSVEAYREQLQSLAGEYLGQPVTISSMDARVIGISPTVILGDVSLLHKDGEQLLTRFDSIDIALDPIASLRHLKPIIELTVSGANLEISRNQDGSFGVQGLELAESGNRESQEKSGQVNKEIGLVLGNWFLSQSRLALRNSNITLYDRVDDERFSFRDVELEMRNDGNRHRLSGFVHLPKRIGRELRVAVDIDGDLLQGKNWKGELYLKTEQLRPQAWTEQLSWMGSGIRDGMLSLELWSTWGEGAFVSATTRIEAFDVVLSRGDKQQLFPHIGVDAKLTRPHNGWLLDVSNLRLQHGDSAAPPMRLRLAYQNDAKSIMARQLDLGALATLLPYLPMLDEKQQAMVSTIAPAGIARTLHVKVLPENRIIAQGDIGGLNASPWEKLPGVSGVNAQFSFNGEGGRLQLQTSQGELFLPRLFRAPLKLGSMTGELVFLRESDGWQLHGENMEVDNGNVHAELDMSLLLQKGHKPWLSLQGRFSGKDATAVPHYLPAGKLKEKSLYWLDHAFKAGSVPGGSLQFHGFTGDFPFLKHQGRFEVLFDAEDVQLHYRDDWPDLHQLSGEVHFDGLGMQIKANGARVFDAVVGETRVAIDNLRAARLLVDGNVALSVNDGIRFLRESPLSRNTGKVLDSMKGGGEASLALQLAIPISPVVKEKLPLDVKGRVDFQDNRLDIIDGVSVEGLRGELHFTENSFQADQLQGMAFDDPVSIVVASDSGDKPKVVIAARGRADISALQSSFKLPLLNYLKGKGDWQASLELPRGVAAEGAKLHINSSLLGVSSSLPVPLEKEADSERNMYLSFHLGGARQGETEFRLSDELGAVWRRDQSARGREWQRLQLRLGADNPLALPGRDSIEIIGRGGEIEITPWLEVLRSITAEAEAGEPLPVTVKLEKLHLVSEDNGSDDREPVSVRKIPQLDFSVDDFYFNDLPLGRTSLKLLPKDRRLSIKDIHLKSDIYTLTGNGEWNEGGNSFFNYDLQASRLDTLMKRFNFATVIQNGETSAKGKVWWDGAPTDVSLAGLNGEMALRIKDGTIVDADPGAGRMLGILSLSALPRRLFLDFSDVFKKGLAFSKIAGNIRVEQGQAYTSNLQLKSTPANILITGRTGLASQDFDQEMFVVPNVSDTATVASALAWGPQVAAVVALFQEMFKEDISAATMIRYQITGSWQQPRIHQILEQEEEEALPFYEQ